MILRAIDGAQRTHRLIHQLDEVRIEMADGIRGHRRQHMKADLSACAMGTSLDNGARHLGKTQAAVIGHSCLLARPVRPAETALGHCWARRARTA